MMSEWGWLHDEWVGLAMQCMGVHLKLCACSQVLAGLQEFGQSDNLYSLLNEYEIQPWETWAIEEKVIHAPGK